MMRAVGMEPKKAEIKDTETKGIKSNLAVFCILVDGTILPTEMETFRRSMFGGKAAKLVM